MHPNGTSSHYLTKKFATLLCILLVLQYVASAQSIFKGVLINTADSLPVKFAFIEVKRTSYHVLTDSLGAFSFELPGDVKKVELDIRSINCRAKVNYQRTFAAIEKVYVDVAANPLEEFVLRGLSATEVVEQAVAAISRNFECKSHFGFYFYREFEKADNRYSNFIEAEAVVRDKLTVEKKQVKAAEAFAIPHIRRSKYEPIISDFMETELDEILAEDPIYHLHSSSLMTGNFGRYHFSFDTSHKADDYVINYYRSDFTSESHGINGYTYSVYYGEAAERGTITIERGTFAIRKFERYALINPSYDYGPDMSNINVVRPSKRYFFRFVNGKLTAEYKQVNGKWHLDKLLHEYTNNFYRSIFGSFAFSHTFYTELYCDSVSRYVGEDLVKKFYDKAYLSRRRYTYDAGYWDQHPHPFYFVPKETLFHALGTYRPLKQQFIEEGKKE